MRNVVAGLSMAATLAIGGVAYAVTPSSPSPVLAPDAAPPRAEAALIFGEGQASPVLSVDVDDIDLVSYEGDPVDPVAPEPPPAPTAIPTVKVEPTPIPTANVEPTPIPTVKVEPTATAQPTPEPTVEPPGYGAVTLQGDVSVNGQFFVEDLLIGVVWDEEDPSDVQLWTIWNDEPVLVCDGTVYELAGEPVYHADSQLLGPSGRCHGQRVPDGGDGVVLFITFSDGQWVAATLTDPDGVPAVDIFN